MKHICRDDYPYSFDPEACKQCSGRCCSGESGNIWVNSREIRALAALLGLNEIDFRQQHLRQVGNRWSLAERAIGDQMICTFFDENLRRCSVYTARPDQCRTFPFWEYFRQHVDALVQECPGVIPSKNKVEQGY